MLRSAAIRLLPALALGAATTIAFSWAIAATRPSNASWFGQNTAGSFGLDRGDDLLLICQGRALAHRAVLVEVVKDRFEKTQFREFLNQTDRLHSAALPAWSHIDLSPGSGAQPAPRMHPTLGLITPDRFSYVVNAYGWPALAMRGVKIETLPTGGAWRDPSLDHPHSILLGPRRVAVPASILWPGFLLNSLIFAAAWFIAVSLGGRAARLLAARLRARRALRRGRCPKCRYDLLGDFSSGCPECGWKRSTPAHS
ncbi:MAG: hypothetical protein KF869_13420 [Phycisphaeraceae bacterium]|nr:hypothetical protein [Phycisphaeraceae bacterium]